MADGSSVQGRTEPHAQYFDDEAHDGPTRVCRGEWFLGSLKSHPCIGSWGKRNSGFNNLEGPHSLKKNCAHGVLGGKR